MIDPVCYKNPELPPGAFVYAAVGLDHDHIYGMCEGLNSAGATLKWVLDADPGKMSAFQSRFPAVQIARCEAEILDDPAVALVAAAPIPSDRGALGLRAMDAGKDFFSDKAPFTDLDQLEQARRACCATGRKHFVYYAERVHVEGAIYAGQLVMQGAIGRVIHIIGMGPHRLNAPTRPPWFFLRAATGGILCDLASHQAEQFLFFSGAQNATVQHSRVANYHHPQFPEFFDFGDVLLVADNGCTGYLRVDWFTPRGLSCWGDGRLFIVGTGGYIELRKNIDIARDERPDHLYLVNEDGTFHANVAGQVGFPFFGQLIQDCLHRTETAMTQEHTFRAAEVSLIAQARATRISPSQ